jgi:hypothetical protein
LLVTVHGSVCSRHGPWFWLGFSWWINDATLSHEIELFACIH